jgi:hypothetical protein
MTNPQQAKIVDAGGVPGAMIMGDTKALTAKETERLLLCEVTIKKGLETFIEVGLALVEVREAKLYRFKFGTFEEYCEKRWQMTARRARQICAGAEVVANLRPGPPLPTSERQVRPLAGLPAAEQREVWKDAVAAAPPGEAPTGKQVQEAVEARKWPRANEHGVYDDKLGEHLQFRHRRGSADLQLLQIGPAKWIASVSYQHRTGDLAAATCALKAYNSFPDREAALIDAARNLVGCQREILKGGGCINREQKMIAQNMIDWAHRFLPEESGPLLADRKPKIQSGTLSPRPTIQAKQKALLAGPEKRESVNDNLLKIAANDANIEMRYLRAELKRFEGIAGEDARFALNNLYQSCSDFREELAIKRMAWANEDARLASRKKAAALAKNPKQRQALKDFPGFVICPRRRVGALYWADGHAGWVRDLAKAKRYETRGLARAARPNDTAVPYAAETRRLK